MARIYIGNLPMDVTEKDIDDVFYKFGRIVDIDLKTPARPPAFGFVTFQDPRDADEAVRARDGYEMDGSRLRVEISRGRRDMGGGGFGGGYGGGFGGPGGMRGGFGGGGMGRGFGGAGAQMTEYRVIVTGLPPSASWQDLKDHMRKAGEPTYTDVDHKGGGIVHFRTRDDMEYALRKLDGTDFRNPFEKSRISVLPHRATGGGRDSRSRSRSPRRRRGRSPSSSRSRSRSPRRRRRPRSVSRSKSRSRSRSRSRGRRRSARSESRSRSRSPSRSRSRSRGSDRDRGDRMDDGDDRRDAKDDRSDRSRSPDENGRSNGVAHENGDMKDESDQGREHDDDKRGDAVDDADTAEDA